MRLRRPRAAGRRRVGRGTGTDRQARTRRGVRGGSRSAARGPPRRCGWVGRCQRWIGPQRARRRIPSRDGDLRRSGRGARRGPPRARTEQGSGAPGGGRSVSPTGTGRRRAPPSWRAAAMESEGRRRKPVTPSPAAPPFPSRHAGALCSRVSLGPTGCARCRRHPVARSGAANPPPAAPERPHRGGGSAPRRSAPVPAGAGRPPSTADPHYGPHRGRALASRRPRSPARGRPGSGVRTPLRSGAVVRPRQPPCPPAAALRPRSPGT